MSKPSHRLLMPSAAAILAASLGCSMGPNFRRPVLEVPTAFAAAAEQGDRSADLGWWEIVNDDPVLKGLVVEALDHNRDLRMAVSRMEEASALAGINHLGPNLDAGISGQRQRGLVAGAGPRPVLGNQFSASVSATWELDLWGHIRRRQESAAAQYLASAEGRRAVLLRLVGDVVGGYYQLRSLDMKLEMARRTVETRQQSLDLVRGRMAGGIGDQLETSQAASALAMARAAIPALEQAVHGQETLLNLLVGRMPGPIERGAPLASVPPKGIAPGLPSALLERRPDVRQSEAMLRSANAEVGVATAQLFPTLSLTGSFGFQSLELSKLTQASQRSWGMGGGLLAPVFHGKELRNQRKAAVARWEQAKAGYEKTVLAALGDASHALVALAKSREAVKAQEELLASMRQAERIAQMRFEGGVSPYLEVLDAQRGLFSAEQGYAEALCDQQQGVIRLYLALGGGWNKPERPAGP
ncbi:MAG TPA: efflux transporter outer membrane subunit [Holophaga sp.]|nr:efflux transporter outer membrane subunit [Holophaga sp.]